MKYSSQEILEITGAKLLNNSLIINDVSSVEYDTRKIFGGANALFIAFVGNSTNGHQHISNAFEKGVSNFIVTDKNFDFSTFENANFFLVEDAYLAIQKIAGHHRNKFNLTLISITGSNGKTIVKEWLAQCLARTRKVIKSPVSFNSQLGVALSLLLIEDHHEFAIIEAGISSKGEMQNLADIIKPDIGILTNIGDAHSAGFSNRTEKLNEKLKLFSGSEKLIANFDQEEVRQEINSQFSDQSIRSWSSKKEFSNDVISIQKKADHAILNVTNGKEELVFKVPFTDDASLENITHVVSVLLEIGIDKEEIQTGILSLDNLPMRLELKEGINNCLILDDSYSFDLESLKIGIRELNNNANTRDKSIIISDLDDQNSSEASYSQLVKILEQLKLKRLIIIGNDLKEFIVKSKSDLIYQSYATADEMNSSFSQSEFENEIILIKGARQFSLDKISKLISARQNKSVFEIDLFALAENIDYFRNSIPKETGLMAVLKASAYGSGSQQLSSLINNRSIDMLAVAIIEEAVEMKKAGITKPILIFNPHADSLNLIAEYDFEIELSNKSMAIALLNYVSKTDAKIKVHLKLDTGMNRLGFKEDDFVFLGKILAHPNIIIKAIFSHLAAADDAEEDEFSKKQLALYDKWYALLSKQLGSKPKRHILNSSGSLRFKNHQYDYVRIGLGLYGLDLTGASNGKLTKVHSLKSYIVQIKDVAENETIGYGNKLRLKKAARIAVIGIGYADGLMRKSGSESYPIVIKGQKAPLIGNVCMDLCMADISELEGVKEGDEVLIFGKNHPIEALSAACDTIPYEILTRVAPRVKRVYIQ